MGVLGLYKAFNALNSDDIQDLVELASDYLNDLSDEMLLSESYQTTIKVAEELLTLMKEKYENAKSRNRSACAES